MRTHLPLHTTRNYKKSEGKLYQYQNLSVSVKDIVSKVFGIRTRMLDFYNVSTYRKVPLQVNVFR
jgi:hypothetical protein